MALIECLECKHQLSDSAPRCPHCGAKNRDRCAGPLAYVVAAVGAVVVGFVMLMIYTGTRPHAHEAAQALRTYKTCIQLAGLGDRRPCEKILDDFQANYGYRP